MTNIYNFDVEADALLENVTKVHCICAEHSTTNEMFIFHDKPEFDGAELEIDGGIVTLPYRNGSLRQGVDFLKKADGLNAHNFLGYDWFVLNKFYPDFDYPLEKCRDTLLESQNQWFDRPPVKGVKGRHGLEPWGAKLGTLKPAIKDWSVFTKEILHRCIEDVVIQRLTSNYLTAERAEIKKRCNGIEFSESMKIEKEYRFNCTRSEIFGAKVDIEHMRACVVELDELISVTRDEIEPDLPMYPTYSAKETLHEVAKKLGRKKIPPVKYVMKEHGGELKQFSVKKWWTPSVNFTKKVKIVNYEATHKKTCNVIKGYAKLKEIRYHIKEELGHTYKEYDFKKIEEEGKLLNSHTANHFEVDESRVDLIWGPHTRLTWNRTRLTQGDKVKKYLLDYCGWVPLEYNYKKDKDGRLARDDKYRLIETSPKLTEESYDSIEGGLGDKIAKFNTYSHRRGFLQNLKDPEKGIINLVREDGRLTCGVNVNATSTGRSSHFNFVNVPGNGSIYGTQMRKIIVTDSPDHVLGCVDIPSCHPRILADLSKDQEFIDSVTTGAEDEEITIDGVPTGKYKYLGSDFHTRNAVIFKLMEDEDRIEAVSSQDQDLIYSFMKPRKTSKGGFYCCIYGGSGKKLATILKVSEAVGEERKQYFLDRLGLSEVLKEMEDLWDCQKWGKGSYVTIKGGYSIWCNSKHKLINYMALGCEGVLNKIAVNWLEREIKRLGLKTMKIITAHDENLFSIPKDELEVFKPLAEEMYTVAGKQMGFDISFDSTLYTGVHYGETH